MKEGQPNPNAEQPVEIKAQEGRPWMISEDEVFCPDCQYQKITSQPEDIRRIMQKDSSKLADNYEARGSTWETCGKCGTFYQDSEEGKDKVVKDS